MTNREKFQEAMQKEVDAIKEWSAEKFVDQMKSTGFHWSNIFQGFLWGHEGFLWGRDWLAILKDIDGEKLIEWLNEQAKGEMGQAMTNREKFHDLMQKDVDTFKEWSDERLVGYVQHPAFHWHNPFQDFFYNNGWHERIEEIDKPRVRRNVFPIIGRGREGMPSVSKPSRNNRRHVVLFTLGVTTIKGTLFSRLKVENRGAGYCHFPLDAKKGHRGYDSVYFKGLLSERMVVKRVKGRDTITWEVRSPGLRNEPLDARVYATGALELFNPNFEAHKKRRNKSAKTLPLPKLKQPELPLKPEEPKPAEIKKPVTKARVTGGFFKRGLRM